MDGAKPECLKFFEGVGNMSTRHAYGERDLLLLIFLSKNGYIVTLYYAWLELFLKPKDTTFRANGRDNVCLGIKSKLEKTDVRYYV